MKLLPADAFNLGKAKILLSVKGLTLFPSNKILDKSKLKILAEDKMNVTQNLKCVEIGRKDFWKKRKCWLPAFSPFLEKFSKAPFFRVDYKPITRRHILDSSKLKEFADDNFKFDENGRKLSKWVENTVGKGEIARYEQFLLFPQCFQKACFPGASKGVIVWEWVKVGIVW